MHHYTSAVRTFLATHVAHIHAEPVTQGLSKVDWLLDVAGNTVIIKEKSSACGFSSQILHRAANQLEVVSADDPGAFRILWLTSIDRPETGKKGGAATPSCPIFDDFFQSHSGIDGVVTTLGASSEPRTVLCTNPFSIHHDHLNHSRFAALFAPTGAIHPDFPREAILGAVSGVQPKLLLTRSGYSTYTLPRRSVDEIARRFQAADDIVVQLHEYFLRKSSEHPEWSTEKNLERIRLGLANKAAAGNWPFSVLEQQWIMNRLRERSHKLEHND